MFKHLQTIFTSAYLGDGSFVVRTHTHRCAYLGRDNKVQYSKFHFWQNWYLDFLIKYSETKANISIRKSLRQLS
jgi:hypothetical protein